MTAYRAHFRHACKCITGNFGNPLGHLHCSIILVAEQRLDMFFQASRAQSSPRLLSFVSDDASNLLWPQCSFGGPRMVTLESSSFISLRLLLSDGSDRTNTTTVLCPSSISFSTETLVCPLPYSPKNTTGTRSSCHKGNRGICTTASHPPEAYYQYHVPHEFGLGPPTFPPSSRGPLRNHMFLNNTAVRTFTATS